MEKGTGCFSGGGLERPRWDLADFDGGGNYGYTYDHNSKEGLIMKFVSVAEVKNRLTVYLAQARKKKEPA